MSTYYRMVQNQPPSPDLQMSGQRVLALDAQGTDLTVGGPGLRVRIEGADVSIGPPTKCSICSADTPIGVTLNGATTRVLFCFACAKQHLHGSVSELIDQLDVKDKLEKGS